MILFTGVGHPQTVDYAEYSLISFGKPLALLGVAGVDKVFYRATATIKSSSVKVESGQASTSVAVRYACKEFVTSDLFSDDGMLTSSFQTDTRDLAATPLKSTTDNLFLPFMRRRTFLKNVPPSWSGGLFATVSSRINSGCSAFRPNILGADADAIGRTDTRCARQ